MRTSFPRGAALIWYNEAAILAHSPIRDSCGNPHRDYAIPPELDWFSVDIYHMNGAVAGWVNNSVRAYYERWIYPNLTAGQRVMLVPGSFGSDVNHYPNGTVVCDRACYDAMVSADAADFYHWAVTDERVAAVEV